MTEPLVIPEMSADTIGPVEVDLISIGDKEIKLARPNDIDRLIESKIVSERFQSHGYMPYWAALWPVGRSLSHKIFAHHWPSPLNTLELGCGLGLCGIAAMLAGHAVTLSDYDQSALVLAAKNAKLNGVVPHQVIHLNWKAPPDLKFDFILGSDLAWTSAVIPDIVNAIASLLDKSGTAWLADQDRIEPFAFDRMLRDRGLVASRSPLPMSLDWGWDLVGYFYEIRWKV